MVLQSFSHPLIDGRCRLVAVHPSPVNRACGRSRVVFESQLHRLGEFTSGDVVDEVQREVDARRDTGRREELPVLDPALCPIAGTQPVAMPLS